MWISVSEKVPPHGTTVLVAHEFGVNEAEYCEEWDGKEKKSRWDAPYYGQEIIDGFNKVTHWMFMPSEPNETVS